MERKTRTRTAVMYSTTFKQSMRAEWHLKTKPEKFPKLANQCKPIYPRNNHPPPPSTKTLSNLYKSTPLSDPLKIQLVTEKSEK